MTGPGSNSRSRHVTRPSVGSVVVDSLLYVPPIVCGGSLFGLFLLCIT